MSRKTFLIISAILAFAFGIAMLLFPSSMLGNMATVNSSDMQHVLQWAGTMLLAIAFMNFLSRNDPGSVALRALMIGNIFLHVVGFMVDIYDLSIHFIKPSGLVSGAIVHGLLTFGFVYFLIKLSKSSVQTSNSI